MSCAPARSNKFLTKYSGLAHAGGARIFPVMSINVFMGICVLACDFLIYAFFQWTFGEKRREFARRHPLSKAGDKKTIEIAAPRLSIVRSVEETRPEQDAAAGRKRRTELEVA
jgi:hypothetical protein